MYRCIVKFMQSQKFRELSSVRSKYAGNIGKSRPGSTGDPGPMLSRPGPTPLGPTVFRHSPLY